MNKVLHIVKRDLLDSKIALAAVAAFALMIGGMFTAFYPTFSDPSIDFQQYIEAFPPAMLEAFNISADADYSDFEYFISSEYFGFFWMILYLPFIFNWATKIGTEAESGLLALKLSYPVKRSEIVAANFISLFLKVTFTIFMMIAAVLGTASIVDIDYNLGDWTLLSLFMLLFSLTIAFMAQFFSLAFLKKSRAVWLTLGIILLGYFFNVIAKIIKSIDNWEENTIYLLLEKVKFLTLFHYFGDPIDVINNKSMDETAVVVFTIIIITSITASFLIFRKKNLPAG